MKVVFAVSLIFTMPGVLLIPVQGATPWYDLDWDYRKQITIDSLQVDSTLTNFPVLVSYTNVDLGDNAQADCDDILFTDSTHLVKLSHEIEECDLTASDTITAWVKIPSVSSSVDTDFFMYYGNSVATSQEDPESTFTDYDFVLHLHDDFLDSTANNNDGTNNGSTDVSCLIADCQSFDEVNDYIQITDSTSLSFPDGDWALQMWLAIPDNTGTTYQYFYSQGAFGGNPSMNIYTVESSETTSLPAARDDIKFYGRDSAGDFYENVAGEAFLSSNDIALTTSWQYITYVRTGNDIQLYVNDTLNTSATNSLVDNINVAGDLFLGGRSDLNSARFYGGDMDEVKKRSSALSSAWISAEYDNQKSGSTFLTIGAQVPKPIITSITDGLIIGDSVLAGMDLPLSASDGLIIGDSETHQLNALLTLNISDGLIIGDSETHQVNALLTLNVSDGLVIGDSSSLQLNALLTLNASDGLIIGDSQTSILSGVIPLNVNDGIIIGDTELIVIDCVTTCTIEISEGLVIGDGTIETTVSVSTFNSIKLYLNTPTSNRLGGIFAQSCSPGFYVSGIDTNGVIECTVLP